jgi:DNA helicase-2/ATP-dependent DNA helicase PcrA
MLDRFNPQQREAATTIDGPLLVIAGAGSGKTSVLTARIAYLIQNGADPSRILALTFTKKAAEEMRERIIALSGPSARRICMGTFHSVFIRFLRPNAGRIGFPPGFTILDEDDSTSCLSRCIQNIIGKGRPPKQQWSEAQKKYFAELDANYKTKQVKEIISAYKNELITADMYDTPQQALRNKAGGREMLGPIFREYRDQCLRMGMMDFDDILLYTDILLANNPDVKNHLAASFDYILVDEYQDTNTAQYSILKRLTEWNRNICVVGDDSQSIYAFRGAKVKNIIDFPEHYAGCRVIKLERNYRSTQNIVNAANNVISHNETRIDKTCFTDAEKGAPILMLTGNDEREEAKNIVKTILEKKKEDKDLRYSDFAVLFRTNAQSRAIEDALVRNRIPYTVYSGTNFFSRMEVKDLMAYFRLAVNPGDDEAFLRVVNKPARGVGKKALETVCNVARSWNCSIWQAVTHPQFAFCGLQPKAYAGVKSFIEEMVGFIEMTWSKGAYETACAISDKVGFYAEYLSQNDEESQDRANNIRELVDSVKAFEEEVAGKDPDDGQSYAPNLAGFLENISLLSNADTGDDKEDKVSLMTVHCAKGLEFNTVFVSGTEQKLFPMEIDKTQFELEEERRLFYVAITRAKKNLYITKAKSRIRFGTRMDCYPSPFIGEMRSSAK